MGYPHEVKLAIIQPRVFSHQKGTHIHVFLHNICRLDMSYHTLFEGVNFVLSYSNHIWNVCVSENVLKIKKNAKNEACL